MIRSKKVDWDYWLGLPSMDLWKAVALSLDIDPNNMGHRDEGIDSGLHFGESAFPSESIKAEYEERLRLLATSLPPRILKLAALSQVNPSYHRAPVAEVATWLTGIGRKQMPLRLMQAAEATLASNPVLVATNRAVINLAADKTSLTVEEIPTLIADALYPRAADSAEMTVSYLLKTTPQDTLGTKLTSDDRRHVTQVWRDLPRYEDGMTETKWRKYEAAFNSSRSSKPNWQLTPVWANHGLNNQIMRLAAEEQHRVQLNKYILSGSLQAFSPAMTQLSPKEGTAPFARILIEDLRPYLENRVRLNVYVATAATSQPAQEMAWIEIARSEGKKIHKASPKLNLEQIAERVHEKLKAAKVIGRSKRVPSASSIKRHALKGIKK